MSPAILMDPGFYVRPLLDPAVARQFALISSSMVFEDADEAASHLEALVLVVDPCLLVTKLSPRPVRAHVPGAEHPCRSIGYRLSSIEPAPVGAVAGQVEALHAAAARLGMAGSHSLEPFTR